MRIRVREDFRELLLKRYVKLIDTRHLRLVRYLLFSSFIDKDTGYPFLTSKQLAGFEEKEKEYNGKHYSGERYLRELQNEILNQNVIKWLSWQFPTLRLNGEIKRKGKYRRVELNLGSELMPMLEGQLFEKSNFNQLVNIETGKPWTLSDKRMTRKEECDEAVNSY